jgi:PPOX class probable F420-dependent enzyme
MSDAEVDEFLARLRQSGHLATVRADGTPQVAPMWFWWERPILWLVTFRTSARVHNVARADRVALSVDANQFPAVGAVLYGRTEVHETDPRVLEAIVRRYLPAAQVATFVDRYHTDENRVLLKVHVDRILAWDAAAARRGRKTGGRHG